jgi:hypothetical protein
MKHEFASRRRGINGFLQALEPDLLLFQFRYQFDQVLERPAQAIKPPDHQHVPSPQQFPDAIESLAALG